MTHSWVPIFAYFIVPFVYFYASMDDSLSGSSGHRMWRGTCEGFQNRDPCLNAAQILIQLKQWWDQKWVRVSVALFKALTDDMQNLKEYKTCRSCRLVRTQTLLGNSRVFCCSCGYPAQKCASTESNVVVPRDKPFLTHFLHQERG